ncbi:hypothetical protein EJC47_06965 [Sphingomonas sp. TF3]|uniref:hypothetical protein n=1 Tax=unclassified Sphingomonas TaxID=196159 RepID=UPI000F860823|nr:hypothetical protein [Sphingomonas sp. TF3]RUN77224.1 hypothetical protein EJC47_06965 [Sphingomonas sp. TF3]
MTDTTRDSTTPPANDTIIEQAEGLFEQAKGALNDAFEATVEAVKEHPLAAVGIAAGAAAAVAGAAFGASKILSKDDATATTPKKA